MSGPEGVASEPKNEEPKFVFPPLDKGAQVLYDNEALTIWVGIPILTTDPMTAGFVLDATKMNFLARYQENLPTIMKVMEERRRQAEASAKIVKPKGSLSEMMERLKSAIK